MTPSPERSNRKKSPPCSIRKNEMIISNYNDKILQKRYEIATIIISALLLVSVVGCTLSLPSPSSVVKTPAEMPQFTAK
jgi:hypothetical protein